MTLFIHFECVKFQRNDSNEDLSIQKCLVGSYSKIKIREWAKVDSFFDVTFKISQPGSSACVWLTDGKKFRSFILVSRWSFASYLKRACWITHRPPANSSRRQLELELENISFRAGVCWNTHRKHDLLDRASLTQTSSHRFLRTVASPEPSRPPLSGS